VVAMKMKMVNHNLITEVRIVINKIALLLEMIFKINSLIKTMIVNQIKKRKSKKRARKAKRKRKEKEEEVIATVSLLMIFK
jgi:hypothetical protein